MRIFLIRFTELVGLSIILSALVTVMCLAGIIPNTSEWYAVGFLIAAIIYFIVQTNLLRGCFYGVQNTKVYYFYNYLAYAAYIVLNVILYVITGDGVVYTWVMGIVKFIHYWGLWETSIISALVFHMIMFLIILVAPTGIRESLEPEMDIPDEYFARKSAINTEKKKRK